MNLKTFVCNSRNMCFLKEHVRAQLDVGWTTIVWGFEDSIGSIELFSKIC